jgi:hypothetical protein
MASAAIDQPALLEQLRGQIRKLEAQPRTWLLAFRTGVEELDALGAFRLGSGVALCGEEASGRTTMAMSVVAAACREQRLSAWVDGPAELYPPAALNHGIDLQRLLIVRPKAPGQLVWTAVQLLRSGAFGCVVLDVNRTGLVLSLTDSKKLLDAARAGGSLLVVLSSKSAAAPSVPRLTMQLQSTTRPAARHLRVVGATEPQSASQSEIESESESEVDTVEGELVFEIESLRGHRLVIPRSRLASVEFWRARRLEAHRKLDSPTPGGVKVETLEKERAPKRPRSCAPYFGAHPRAVSKHSLEKIAVRHWR